MNATIAYGEPWIGAERSTEALAVVEGIVTTRAYDSGATPSQSQWLDPRLTQAAIRQLEFLGDHVEIGEFVTEGTLAATGISLLLHARKVDEPGDPSYVVKIPSAFLKPAEDPRQPAEIAVLSELGEHPNIPKLIATGLVPVRPDSPARYWYYVTPEVPQGTLGRHLPVRTEAQGRRAIRVLAGATRAAMHAHDKGYAHNDINGENIFVDEDEGRLGDWGGAAPIGSQPQQLTPPYSPSEVVARAAPATPESDVYALGATLVSILTDETTPNPRLVFEEVQERPNRHLDPRLVQIAEACVDTPPNRITTSELLAALAAQVN